MSMALSPSSFLGKHTSSTTDRGMLLLYPFLHESFLQPPLKIVKVSFAAFDYFKIEHKQRNCDSWTFLVAPSWCRSCESSWSMCPFQQLDRLALIPPNLHLHRNTSCPSQRSKVVLHCLITWCRNPKPIGGVRFYKPRIPCRGMGMEWSRILSYSRRRSGWSSADYTWFTKQLIYWYYADRN